MKKALVLGGCGFIGQHLVERLWQEGYDVTVVDRYSPEFPISDRHLDFRAFDLAGNSLPKWWFFNADEVYQLAAEVGGLGFIHNHDNDVLFLDSNARINMNVLRACGDNPNTKIFFASSACVYPSLDNCHERDAYPAQCDNEYAWEKLYSERLYMAYAKATGVKVAIGRLHNTYGPYHCYDGGREKAPAAICRKVAKAVDEVEVWGTGKQTRTFMYIDDCIEGIRRLMKSDYSEPVNIGSDEKVSLDVMTTTVMDIANKDLRIKHVEGEMGVGHRASDNRLIRRVTGWSPSISLYDGLKKTYSWVKEQIDGEQLKRSQSTARRD